MSDPLREDIVDLFASNPNAEAGDLLDVIRVWAAEAAPPSDPAARMRDAAAAIALDYHSLAISGDDQDEDGNLHPAVTWARCTAPKCAALRAALEADHD